MALSSCSRCAQQHRWRLILLQPQQDDVQHLLSSVTWPLLGTALVRAAPALCLLREDLSAGAHTWAGHWRCGRSHSAAGGAASAGSRCDLGSCSQEWQGAGVPPAAVPTAFPAMVAVAACRHSRAGLSNAGSLIEYKAEQTLSRAVSAILASCLCCSRLQPARPLECYSCHSLMCPAHQLIQPQLWQHVQLQKPWKSKRAPVL